MKEHSPAPWKFGDWCDDPQGEQPFLLLDANGRPVFWCLDRHEGSIGAANGTDLDMIESAPELLAMLRDLEWSVDEGHVCPRCGGNCADGLGHAPDCRLDALLARFK